jgi:hypothetical protein
MAISSEVQASIIKVSGDWALAMASASELNGEPMQPSQNELERDFDFAYKFLTRYLGFRD